MHFKYILFLMLLENHFRAIIAKVKSSVLQSIMGKLSNHSR